MLHFRRRFAPAIAFVQARLSPTSYLGMHLTAGAIVLLAAGWLFGGVAEDVATNDPLTKVDVQVAHWLHEQVTARMTDFMLGVSTVSGPLAISIYVLGATAYLIYKREWYWFASLIVTVPTGMLVNTLMKLAFHRARPSLDHPIVSLASYSFPSGHAAGATLFFGLLASFVIWKFKSWSWRVAALLASVAVVMLVSFSRMYLGAHYLTDVLGGMAEGVAWLAFCLTGMHTYRGHRAAQRKHQPQHQGARSR